ncbi:MAG: tRNA (N6-threonylcarbamoyladenosine(37)-N6)-methyltransferase TrmO, partial [Polyangiaceae bacterium]|nr:tRNA (N6-threonylcarbamoyladenosine(37)-N6)-methyltransferase TrmO [Polyangiaceae bacterium]
MVSKPSRDYSGRFPSPLAISMTPIGVVRSPHVERHGTPRQPEVSGEREQRECLSASIVLNEAVIGPESLQDLEGFDRIWALGYFHLNQGWKAQVVPPRGPRVKRGLLSTRAPHRPNGIALSCCRLLRVEGLTLHLGPCDLLDGTPILDIKPYLPFADAFPGARAGWVDELSERS